MVLEEHAEQVPDLALVPAQSQRAPVQACVGVERTNLRP